MELFNEYPFNKLPKELIEQYFLNIDIDIEIAKQCAINEVNLLISNANKNDEFLNLIILSFLHSQLLEINITDS